VGVFGFFAIHKPPGPTSHDVVAGVRRLLGRGVKVGHAGTLDPFAEGVLVVCVGAATRLADYVQAAEKRYSAVVVLGATSSTDDPEGQIAPACGLVASPAERDVRGALGRFVGEIQQVPPSHSAVHVEGRRAYKLARRGQAVDLPARTVTVHALDLVSYEYPRLRLDVRCGSGTYVRALARDLGAALGTGGYCGGLIRTAVGRFHVDQSVRPEDLDLARDLLSPLLAVEHLPHVTIPADLLPRLLHGNALTPPTPLPPEAAGTAEAALLDEQGRLIALAEIRDAGRWLQPTKVFLTAPQDAERAGRGDTETRGKEDAGTRGRGDAEKDE
jgi:tRNA pseudouridine55 synthase